MFFALEREEVVEERPFRAVKKESFRKRALALVASLCSSRLSAKKWWKNGPLGP